MKGLAILLVLFFGLVFMYFVEEVPVPLLNRISNLERIENVKNRVSDGVGVTDDSAAAKRDLHSHASDSTTVSEVKLELIVDDNKYVYLSPAIESSAPVHIDDGTVSLYRGPPIESEAPADVDYENNNRVGTVAIESDEPVILANKFIKTERNFAPAIESDLPINLN